MKPIVEVQNLSKRYTLGEIGVTSIRATLDRWLGRGDELKMNMKRREFMALSDVNFSIPRGETVAILGHNGAGKSTLLKVLSRITEPTTGRVTLRGRVASLLEVGTGFHPELSGRDNIFLNGALLGMKRAEIARKLDTIVEFAEVAQFIDTPVKRYSTGMYVRLAFAVAAHLEPDILVVDEVLAVGDQQFQKKCLGKMQDVSAQEGRTVLFVSHNLQAAQSLCRRAIRLDHGKVVADGTSAAVVSEYLASISAASARKEWSETDAPGNEFCKLRAVRVISDEGDGGRIFNSRAGLTVEVEFDAKEINNALCVGFDLANGEGIPVFRSYQTDAAPDRHPPVRLGRNKWRCRIPAGIFNAGIYYVSARIAFHGIEWIVNLDAVTEFEMVLDHGVSPFWNSESAVRRPGLIAPIFAWEDAA